MGTIAGKTGGKILTLIAFTCFLRYFGPTEFGKYVLWQAFLGFISLFCDLGITNAVIKRVSEEKQGKILATGLAVKIGISTIPVSAILIYSALINRYLGAPLALTIIPALLSNNILSVFNGALKGEQRVATAEALKNVSKVAYITGGIVAIQLGYGILGLILAKLVSEGIETVVTYRLLSTGVALPSIETARSLLTFGKFDFIASSIGTASYQWIDTIIIGLFFGSAAVAAYEGAWRVSLGVVLISQATGNAIFPAVSNLADAGKKDIIESYFPRALAAGFFIVPAAAMGAWIVGGESLSMVFGISTEYKIGLVLSILVIARGFDVLNDISGRILMGLDKPKFTAISVIVFIILNIVLNYLFVPWLGIVGAAIATSVAFAANALLNYTFLSNSIKTRIPWREFGIAILAATTMGGVVVTVTRFAPPTSLANVIFGISVGIAIFTTVAILLVLSVSNYSEHIIESIKKQK